MPVPDEDDVKSRQQDRRRARELYKYFLPSDPAILANDWQPSSERPIAPFGGDGAPAKASSPNVTLTAYAQYIAIRLNAQRALISLISSDQLYDVAEATRTLNISNSDSYRDQEDMLWVGCQNVPKADRLCANVVALEQPESGYAFFIVNDMSKDKRFNTLPFVTGHPHFRFYAGTPLTTEQGVNIGSVFVLDGKPRNGLDDDEKEFLGTMSTVCMSYLRTTREALLRRKGARLTQSVRHFGEGRISFILGSHFKALGAKYSSAPPEPSDSRIHTDTESSSDTLSFPAASSKGSKDSRVSIVQPSVRNIIRPARVAAERHTIAAFAGEHGQQQREWMTQAARSDTEARGWTMARAANLIREALDLDEHGGVVFFDATQDFLQFTEDGHDSQDLSSMSDDPSGVVDAHFQTFSDWGPPSGNDVRESFLGIEKSTSGARPRKLASVLASSTSRSPFAISTKVDYELPFHRLPAFLLQRLLKRSPAGKVWAFDADDLVSTEPENEFATPTSTPKSKAEHMGRNTGTLHRIFPQARHLMFMPLWDASKSHWSAGCFVWNTSETQLLDVDTDLTFIEALTRAVTTEISRLETIQADQQKSDFIGSISHELRSPLHGILASLEFLHDTAIDSFQKNLVSTIETCGRTLLDTINHVLDYSKINSLDRDRKRDGGRKIDGTYRHSRTGSTSIDTVPILSTYSETNVATILEEVIEGVKVGQQYRESSIYNGEARSGSIQPFDDQHKKIQQEDQPRKSDLPEHVDIDLDIETGDWTFLTQPGALRRCFMNIFGNALKYTERGSINVSLRSRELDQHSKYKSSNGRLVIFQVSDTGRGISPQFLRSKIYTPFAQEDSLAPGTGLGLSLVRSIVAMLDGRIDIESRQGHGTTVTIVIPLIRPTGEEEVPRATTPNALSTVELERSSLLESKPWTVSIYSICQGWREQKVERQVLYRIAQYISDWIKLSIVPWDGSPLDADVVIIEEVDLPHFQKMIKTRVQADRQLVCVCPDMTDELQGEAQLKAMGFRVHRISKPCGPRKLADILRLCMEESQSAVPSPSDEALIDSGAPLQGSVESDISAAVETLKGFMLQHPGLVGRSSALSGLKSLLNEEKTPIEQYHEEDRTPRRATFVDSILLSPVAVEAKFPTMTTQQEPATSTAEPLSSNKPTVGNASVSRPPRILLVEDNKINLRLLQTFMKKRDLQNVESAENGKLALDAVQGATDPFDIIFMDISMPVMNGFEATSAIRNYEEEQRRKKPGLSPTTIVALTGLASAEDQERAREVGMDLFLIKPVSFKEVAKLLDHWEPCNS